ncbi:MAG: VWA domain-containing protein [Bacteroidales bacterium]|nr:VWA domain-containing protein [Bacteroidales bacterium]
MEQKKINVYNLLIIDESGSMSSIYDQALSGINQTLNGIREAQSEFPQQKQYVSIVTFEGNGVGGVKTRRDRVPVSKVKDMSVRDYQPGGCTPLYDAMGSAISHLNSCIEDGDAVLVTVITDGYENASCEYSGAAVKELVGRQREKGWTFAYIGANQDAVEVAKELNINNALNFDATAEGTVTMSVKYNKARRKFLEQVDCCMAAPADDLCETLGSLSGLFEE